MAIALAASAAVSTALTVSATTAAHSIPAALDTWLPVWYLTDSPSRNLSLSGWTDRNHSLSGGDANTFGCIWKVPAGETSPVTFNYNSGSASSASVSKCMTGLDTTDPFNSNNTTSGTTASVTTFALSSGTLTLSSTSDWAVLVFGTDAAQRTISTPDGNWPVIKSDVSGTNSDHSIHVCAYQGGSTTTPAVSIVMNSSRAYGWAMFNIKASSAAAAAEKGAQVVLRDVFSGPMIIGGGRVGGVY